MDSDTISGTLALHTDDGNDVTLISEDAVGYCFRADILYSVLEKLKDQPQQPQRKSKPRKSKEQEI